MIYLKKIGLSIALLCTQLCLATDPNTFIAFITGFNGPYAIAITPDSLRGYVTDGGTNSIRVIDTDDASPTFNTIIPAPNLVGFFDSPNSIAITPDGKFAYVVNLGNDSVLVIDTSTNSLLLAPNLVGTFDNPADIAIAPNGLYAYVINAGNNSVNVIDINPTSPSYHNILSTPDLDGILNNPFAIGITPNGDYGYIANLSGSVNVINTDPSSPGFNTPVAAPGLAFVNAQPEGFAITPNGLFAYVTNGSNGDVTLLNIDPASPDFNTIISTPDLASAFNFPNDAVATTDGNYVYVTNFLGPTGSISGVSVIDTNPESPTYNQTLSTPGLVAPEPTIRYFTLAAAPNARYIYAVDGFNNNVSVIYTGIIDQPIDFSGCILINRFLLQAEYINRLTWSAPTVGLVPVTYKIYSDAALTDLIATIPATAPLQYDVHNQSPSVLKTYYIVSVDSEGNTSAYASTIVNSFCQQ